MSAVLPLRKSSDLQQQQQQEQLQLYMRAVRKGPWRAVHLSNMIASILPAPFTRSCLKHVSLDIVNAFQQFVSVHPGLPTASVLT